MNIKQLAVTCLLLLLSAVAALAQPAPTVTVKAHQVDLPDGTTRYQYLVSNGGTKTVVGFAIGRDNYDEISELTAFPAGWTPDGGLTQNSSTSPASWRLEVIRAEETPFIELQWSADPTAGILPGQTLSGFSVVTSEPDDGYLQGDCTVFFSDATTEFAPLAEPGHPE